MRTLPGYGIDLDRAVADALSRGEPNLCVKEPDSGDENSLLMLVAINRRIDLVKVMLEAGASITADALAWIIWWSPDSDMVISLLECNIPYNAHCIEAAIRHGRWNLVELLLDYGADINGDYHATYLLHIAAWLGEQEFLEGLLRRGANVHIRHPGGHTALMKACDLIEVDRQPKPLIVETLLKYGSDPNAVTTKGESSLLLCVGSRLPYLSERTDIARILLKYGADPDLALPSGKTPLMFAARDNNLLLATALIENNASLHVKTQDGRSVRDIAVQYRAFEVLELLDRHHGDT